MNTIIFHEKQEASLCAQHCLNSLLQGSYFTAVDLSSIAQQLDSAEQEYLRDEAGGGLTKDEGSEYVKENCGDAGDFSVQVIEKALEVWGLSLKNLASRDMRDRFKENAFNASEFQAFICNMANHWLTIRKFPSSKQGDLSCYPHSPLWFNLNSMLKGPVLISEGFVEVYLFQLMEEGYSIFAVEGNIPVSDAEEIMASMSAEEFENFKVELEVDSAALRNPDSRAQGGISTGEQYGSAEEDIELMTALQRSLEEH
eukprot:Nk52_evm11s62 gene=Nk52_evmTU11s62